MGKTMNKIKNIFYEIGSNPMPFLYGWLSGMIGVAMGFFVVGSICKKVLLLKTDQMGDYLFIFLPISMFIIYLLIFLFSHIYNTTTKN